MLPSPFFCRVTDMSGKELERQQIVEQLRTKQPVLVSVDGRMPDACYLRLPTPAKLIVLLGPGEMRAVTITQPIAGHAS
jgi:hypothetical protein